MLARSDRFAGNVSCLAIIFSGPSRDGPSTLGVHACLLLEQAGIFLILAHGCAVAHAGTCVDTMPDFSTSKWLGIFGRAS
jgi:hypothetical protein